MRIIYITESKPKKQIKLDPIDPLDLGIDLQQVTKWSQNNRQLYNLLINNGLAQFLCNRQFLFQFYKHLQFMYCSLNTIDIDSIKLSNLKVLNLFKNNIKVIQNIPPLCTQLYLDFNNISNVKLKNQTKIQLLSLSHNQIDDKIFQQISKKTPYLRCLNIAYNRLQDIRKFVQFVKKSQKLKILIARNNPFSLLALYYEYITAEIQLDYFDNQKYVKIQPVVQKPPEIKQQKKQQKKDEKKDAKKDTKKGGKVQQKPVQQQKKVQIKIQVPKVKIQEDYKQARLKIEINVLQYVTGTIYDSSIFPQDNLNIKKTQSCFWVAAQLLNKKITTEQNKISMDSIVPDGQINRINFQFEANQTFQATFDNLSKLKNGLVVSVYKQQPIVQTDPESGQQKVLLDDKKQIKMKVQCIGGTFVDLEALCALKKKQILKNYNLFKQQAVSQPLFKKPYENEGELISKHRVQFDSHLAALEQQKRKKQQEQQAAKAQKKGGKDSKKAPAKKQAKKDSKQPVAQKKVVQKCTYLQDSQQYRYLGEQKMYKCVKQHLGIKVIIL